MALFLFTKAFLNDEPIKVFNHRKMKRDFTYIDDIIEGVARVISNPPKSNDDFDRLNPEPGSCYAPYKVYNIGNNKPVKLMDFIETLEKHLGRKAKEELLPLRAGDMPKTYADVDGVIKDIDFRPNTSIDEGIGKFVDWYREYYNRMRYHHENSTRN